MGQQSDVPVSLVIPVFNESRRLRRNGRALAGFIDEQPVGSRLIIVDDGSEDDTLSVARSVSMMSNRIEVLTCPHLGKGAAVESGISYASSPLIGYTDVDLSTPLHEVRRLFEIASRSKGLVIGSRGLPESRILNHQHRRRELLGRAFNLLVQTMLTPGVMDTQCGAKFARAEVWTAILERTRETGFAWDAEAVAIAIRRGLGVHEIGIEWSHDPLTRVDVWRDGISMVNAILGIALRQRAEPVLKAQTSLRTPG